MSVWLVRHGESSLNAAGVRYRLEDVPLTVAGIAQAAAVTVPARPAIVSSPLIRAYGTACVIAATHGLAAPIVADELTERDWGQSVTDVARIAAGYLSTLTGDVIAVTHAGVIKGLLDLADTPPNGSIHLWRP